MIEFFNEDCMTVMARYPDNHFPLAIVDPEYGINISKQSLGDGGGLYRQPKQYKRGDWDAAIPTPEYFQELLRVSKNQIIWGGNYFVNPLGLNSPCWIVWDKLNGDTDFADCELAYTSFKTSVRKFEFRWSGFLQGNMRDKEIRIHPTQKPIALYRWLLENYAEKGQTILDTHGGSMSSAIAAHYFGVDMVICEIDEDYFNAGKERFERETRQIAMAL